MKTEREFLHDVLNAFTVGQVRLQRLERKIDEGESLDSEKNREAFVKIKNSVEGGVSLLLERQKEVRASTPNTSSS